MEIGPITEERAERVRLPYRQHVSAFLRAVVLTYHETQSDGDGRNGPSHLSVCPLRIFAARKYNDNPALPPLILHQS